MEQETRGELLSNVESAISDSIGHTEDSSGNKLESPTAPAIDTSRMGGTSTEQADLIAKSKGYGDKDSEFSGTGELERDELAELLGITAKGREKWTSRHYYSSIKKAWKAHEAKLKASHDSSTADLRSKAEQAEQAQQIFATRPIEALRVFAEYFPNVPEYRRALELLEGGGQGQQSQLPQTIDQLTNHIEQRISKRYEGLERTMRAQEYVNNVALPKVRAQLQKAHASWAGFADHKSEILKHLTENPQASLYDSYIAVVVPRFISDRNKLRGEFVNEINSRPHSTATIPTPGAATLGHSQSDEDPISAAIRSSIKGNR